MLYLPVRLFVRPLAVVPPLALPLLLVVVAPAVAALRVLPLVVLPTVAAVELGLPSAPTR